MLFVLYHLSKMILYMRNTFVSFAPRGKGGGLWLLVSYLVHMSVLYLTNDKEDSKVGQTRVLATKAGIGIGIWNMTIQSSRIDTIVR